MNFWLALNQKLYSSVHGSRIVISPSEDAGISVNGILADNGLQVSQVESEFLTVINASMHIRTKYTYRLQTSTKDCSY